MWVKPPLCHFKRSHRVDSPAGEWPGWRDRLQGLSRDVLLLGEELAFGAPPDDDLGISRGCGPVEARSEGFANQGRHSCVVSADSRVDLAKESDSV